MYQPHILIVEDENRLRKLVAKYLSKEGYKIFEAKDGREALDIWAEEHVDLIILDIMMPEIDGWSVCRNIRQESDVPIIMLTARSEESDKIFGFELGIDQYVTKPFSTKELLARVKALLKKIGKKVIDEKIVVNEVKVDNKTHQVMVKNKEIELTPTEYNLLLYFIENSNIALSREQILDRVWGYDYYGDIRTVDTHVKRLRKKLTSEGDNIVTVRGIGYRFEV